MAVRWICLGMFVRANMSLNAFSCRFEMCLAQLVVMRSFRRLLDFFRFLLMSAILVLVPFCGDEMFHLWGCGEGVVCA